MTAPKWQDGRLDLGRLGEVIVYQTTTGEWAWRLGANGEAHIKTKDKAVTRAVRWLRSALKQAGKRLERK